MSGNEKGIFFVGWFPNREPGGEDPACLLWLCTGNWFVSHNVNTHTTLVRQSQEPCVNYTLSAPVSIRLIVYFHWKPIAPSLGIVFLLHNCYPTNMTTILTKKYHGESTLAIIIWLCPSALPVESTMREQLQLSTPCRLVRESTCNSMGWYSRGNAGVSFPGTAEETLKWKRRDCQHKKKTNNVESE